MASSDPTEPLLEKSSSQKLESAQRKLDVLHRIRHALASKESQNQATAAEFGEKDTLQLSCANYFANEDEDEVVISVLRVGALDGRCSVQYGTADSSAKAGVRYHSTRGTLTFEDGEFHKQVTISIIGNQMWEPVSEFRFVLSNPDNCVISKNLNKARIRIIDTDVFPSNYYKQFLERSDEEEQSEQGHDTHLSSLEEGIEKAGVLRLVFSYLRLILRSVRGIKSRTCIVVALDQLENAYLALTLYLQVYLVDVVFSQSKEARARLISHSGPAGGVVYTTFWISALYLMPLVILHSWALARSHMDMGGRVQEFLQVAVFSRYMNYSKKSREEVSPVRVEDAINHQGKEAAELFLQALELFQITGKVLVMSFFIIGENRTAALPAVFMPCAMLVWIWFHNKQLVEVREHGVACEHDVRKCVHESAAAYSLISNFQQRQSTCEIFESFSKALTDAFRQIGTLKAHNEFFPKWLGTFCISAYLAWAAIHVEDHQVSLGQVLATLRVFAELSEKMTEVFELLMKIASGVGPLQQLTEILNKESDLGLRQELSKTTEKLTLEYLQKALREAGILVQQTSIPVEEQSGQREEPQSPHQATTDVLHNMPIELSGLSFFHTHQELAVLHNVNISIPQGRLVAITGDHGTGKATLCQLLARAILPQKGHIFVPAQLKSLYLEHDPIILKTSAWKNLTFGSTSAQPARVRKILAALMMDATLKELNTKLERSHIGRAKSYHDIAMSKADAEFSPSQSVFEHAEDTHGVDTVEDDTAESDWTLALTASEKAKIHLARALILNPEVLILDKPFTHFGPQDSLLALKAIKDFVRNRGFMLPAETLNLRRPRTCFFSPSKLEPVKEADMILQLHRPLARHGFLTQITHDQLDHIETG